MDTLAKRLTWAREQKGLTQESLAKKAGISQGSIGNLESGLRQSSRKILEIAAALEIDPMWLQNGRGTPTPLKSTPPLAKPNKLMESIDTYDVPSPHPAAERSNAEAPLASDLSRSGEERRLRVIERPVPTLQWITGQEAELLNEFRATKDAAKKAILDAARGAPKVEATTAANDKV